MYQLARQILSFKATYDYLDCLDTQDEEVVIRETIAQLYDKAKRSGIIAYFKSVIENTMDDTVAEEAAVLYRALRERGVSYE